MKKLVGCVLIFVLIVINSVGCGTNHVEPNDNSLPVGEKFEIVWPEIILNRLGSTAEEEAKLIEEIKDKNVYSSLRVNDNNTLTVILTEEQRKNSLSLYIENLEGFIKTYYERARLKTEISEDYSEISFYIVGESDLMETVNGLYVIMSMTLVVRLYETKDADDITVHVKFYNDAKGILLTEADIPWEDIDLTPEMWEEDISNAA